MADKVKGLKKLNKAINRSNRHSFKRYIRKEFMNSDGYAEINVNLYNGIQLFDPLSYAHQLELNPESNVPLI